MKKTVYLYVERDDSEYDYKAGFASYTEANDYRQECQRSWMGHCDYVYLWTGSERINLTRMPKDERNKLLKQIDKMRELYDLLPVKPEWLTREQIDEYAARMGVK